ncbi:MAG: acetate kinase, partial [Chlamydiae bacterium]
EINGFGHRVVHGGETFSAPVIINDDVIKCIEECNELAPLHNPANLAGIRACMKALPEVPNVAVFDTAFHQTMPPKAFQYALPYEFYLENHVRRYGFHGTSHKYVTKTFAALINKPKNDVNVVTVHLGNGSSLTCVKNGKCIDTSMGMTPLQGVIMGTRCGDIDPALVVYLMKKRELTPDEIDSLMNKKSGLLGFSGVSSDMRDVESAAKKGNARASLMLEMWSYSIAKYINAYVGILPKTDAVIFTAGIGENAPDLRKIICENCAGLGIKLSENNNNIRGETGCVSADDSKVPVYVIPTNEELQIAQGTSELLMK